MAPGAKIEISIVNIEWQMCSFVLKLAESPRLGPNTRVRKLQSQRGKNVFPETISLKNWAPVSVREDP